MIRNKGECCSETIERKNGCLSFMRYILEHKSVAFLLKALKNKVFYQKNTK